MMIEESKHDIERKSSNDNQINKLNNKLIIYYLIKI